MGWKRLSVWLAVALVGCGSSDMQSPTAGSANPGSPASLRILLDAEEDNVGEQARRYQLELLVGDEVVKRQTVERPDATPFPVQIEGIPPGIYLLRATGFSADGRYLGRFEQEVEFPTLQQVTVSPIWDPGKTREIGLVSVDEAGEPFDEPSRECVTSSNGRFVFFQSGADEPPLDRSRLYLRDRLLQRTTLISSTGNDISMSRDGRWLVYGRNFEYFLFDRLHGLVRSFGHNASRISQDGNFILSRATNGVDFISRTTGLRRLVAQTGQEPQLSADNRLLASLTQEGILIQDLPAGTSRLFPTDVRILTMTFSGDGRWVAFVELGPRTVPFTNTGPLRLLDTQTGSIRTIASDVHPVLSISHDGAVVAFISPLENLVFNDINGLPDLFVWNRLTRLFARVNVAPDDQAVEGGVAVTNVNQGEFFGPPMLSADGRRVVFLAKDVRLVPETAANDVAVFSSQVPGPGILYLSSGNRLLRFRNAEFAAGNAPPESVLFEAPAGTELGALYLDVAQDRLFAVVKTPPRGEVRVFDNASTRASTDPGILLPLAANGIAGDSTRGLVYISRQATAQISVQVVRTENNGRLTQTNAFSLSGGAGRVLNVDTRFDEIYLGRDGSLRTIRLASGLSGTDPPQRGSNIGGLSAQLQDVRAAVLDPTPRGGLSTESLSDIFTFSGSGSTGRLALYNGQVRFFSGQDQSPLRLQSGLGLEDSAQMAFDRFSGMLYLTGPTGTLVFNRFRDPKFRGADRILNVPSQGLVLDRTH